MEVRPFTTVLRVLYPIWSVLTQYGGVSLEGQPECWRLVCRVKINKRIFSNVSNVKHFKSETLFDILPSKIILYSCLLPFHSFRIWQWRWEESIMVVHHGTLDSSWVTVDLIRSEVRLKVCDSFQIVRYKVWSQKTDYYKSFFIRFTDITLTEVNLV